MSGKNSKSLRSLEEAAQVRLDSTGKERTGPVEGPDAGRWVWQGVEQG